MTSSPSPYLTPLDAEAPYSDDKATSKPPKSKARKLMSNPTFQILGGAILGFVLGYILSSQKATPEVMSWIKLPGDLFLRGLKCIVLPLVFVNIVLAVVEMMELGKAISIGWKTCAMYTFTTVLASVEGIISVLLFQPYFSHYKPDATGLAPAYVQLHCPNDNYVVTALGDSLTCAPFDATNTSSSEFLLHDVNSRFQMTSATKVANDISISTTIQEGIFRKAVPQNIFADLSGGNFVGVICFAIIFAVASQVRPPTLHEEDSEDDKKQESPQVIGLMEELNRIFLVLINWVIALTAPAVISLIAGALGSNSNLAQVFSDIAVLFACFLTTVLFHGLVAYPLIFYFFVRKNPFNFFRHLIRAQTFAFASSSSAATLPVTMQCVEETKEVPSSIAGFVLSLGSTINMDGGAIYFPTCIVFLATSSGLEDQLNAASYFLIVLLSTVGAMGTAPVPSASLVLIITAFNTVFDTTGTPANFSYMLAIDWLMDRIRTVLNVSGDAIMTRIITSIGKLEIVDETQFSLVSHTIEMRRDMSTTGR